MKVLSFSGGLGNQLFCYAFYLHIKEKYPNHRIYGIYHKSRLSEHYGLEIEKWFNVKLPPQKWYATITIAFFYLLKQVIGSHKWIDASSRECKNEDAIAFVAYKYTKRYIPHREWLKWKITDDSLNDRNKELVNFIKSHNTWFIHVRRGDYMSPKYKNLFDGCCPLSYYQRAIEDTIKKEKNPKFVCFSDDINWAKGNLPDVFTTFVDWNRGEDSPIDMYLMSQCNGAIIANSTFSYWGAFLGRKKARVYYPKKWINSPRGVPDIFYDDWISY